MTRWSSVLMLALSMVALAGCGGKDSGAGEVRLGDGSRISLDLPTEQQPAPDDIRGAVSGVVVNEAIFPLPGALVSVRDREIQATTDENGKFVFEAMPPGLYTLEVRMEGYGDGLGTINVKSGQVTKSILQVHRLPALDLYNTAEDVLVGSAPESLVAFDLQPKTVILEASWQGLTETPMGDMLQYEVRPESDSEAFQSGGGPNPLLVRFESDFFPRGEYAIRFSVHPTYWSSPTETRGQVFLTIFYGDPAPEGWSLVRGDT